MINKEDAKIISKRNKAKKIFAAPYRKSINYVRLIDIIRECSDQLYNNSLNRVFEK